MCHIPHPGSQAAPLPPEAPQPKHPSTDCAPLSLSEVRSVLQIPTWGEEGENKRGLCFECLFFKNRKQPELSQRPQEVF